MALPQTLSRRVTLLRTRLRVLSVAVLTLTFAGATPRLHAETIFFSGNLRTDATVTSCGDPSCTLGPTSLDSDYAQWAAVVGTFNVTSITSMEAITYGYGGGTSLTGAIVAPGGLEPYLSLFDSTGNFLASTYFGTYCPTGASTYNGGCDDVALDGGILSPGTYQIALTAYSNLSFADNYGFGNISDGFTGLGNLGSGENLNYAFDVILSGDTPPVPEPDFVVPMGIALAAICRFRRCR